MTQPASPRRLSPEQARDAVAAHLVAAETSPANAASVARALVAAEMDGLAGHGLSRVASYAAQVRAGKVRGHAVPQARRAAPGVLAVDAGLGFAYPALDLATERLPPIAAEQGVALAAIGRSHHCGAMGLVVERLAQDGMVALMLANTPAAIAPAGGRRALYGTNPIAFALPVASGDPLVIDLSLSVVARGSLLAARAKGQPIPEGWALDPDGNPTTDPAAGLAGTMAPLGGAKGTVLALMVELLAAGLTGAHFAYEASSFLDAEGEAPATGQLLIAIAPDRVSSGTLDHCARLLAEIAAEPGARLPGARRLAARAEAAREGVLVPAALLG